MRQYLILYQNGWEYKIDSRAIIKHYLENNETGQMIESKNFKDYFIERMDMSDVVGYVTISLVNPNPPKFDLYKPYMFHISEK